MSIPKKRPIVLSERKYNKNIVTEDYNSELLNESLHTFDQQHELAEYIAGFAIECIKQKKNKCTVNIENFNLSFKNVNLEITKNNLIFKVSAWLSDVDSDGDGTIVINVYKHIDIIDYNEKNLFLDIKEAVMHELGHWYFILTKYNNSGNVDTTSFNQLYEEITQMTKNDKISERLYYIVYALYSVFGNELNAFVSQCHCEVYNYLIQQKEISIKTVRMALIKSTTYNNFIENVDDLKNAIRNNDNKKEYIIHEFNTLTNNKKTNIRNVQQFNKILKFALERNNEALRFCEQTAVNAYYKLKNK